MTVPEGYYKTNSCIFVPWVPSHTKQEVLWSEARNFLFRISIIDREMDIIFIINYYISPPDSIPTYSNLGVDVIQVILYEQCWSVPVRVVELVRYVPSERSKFASFLSSKHISWQLKQISVKIQYLYYGDSMKSCWYFGCYQKFGLQLFYFLPLYG